MRGLFIVSCWILGVLSFVGGLLAIPVTLGASVVGGTAGLIFFGGLGGFARDLIETRRSVQLLLDRQGQRSYLPAEMANVSNKSSALLPDRPLPPEQTDTAAILIMRYGIWGLAALLGLSLALFLAALLWSAFR